jgi:hypothetical protein
MSDHPDDAAILAESERRHRDRRIAQIVAAAPPLTYEKAANLRRLFRYAPPADDAGDDTAA